MTRVEKRYEPHRIEIEVQKRWADARSSEVELRGCPEEKIYYCLEMFPYPSGKLHMGHVRNYAIGDAVARFWRMNGKTVLHPMGYDAFGLPAENAAIQGKAHPRDWTFARVEEMTGQLKRMGFLYDWRRLVVTCRPEYYRWNQWLFLKFRERGLVYRKESPVNWCPKCDTVLANEQVHDGMCWRHDDTPVTQKRLAQWFVRTTAYADRLIDNLDRLSGWPEHVKEMQRHWIGRSEGAILRFPVEGSEEIIETFTTRPDTVYGITYLVVAPEHPIVERLVAPDRRVGLDEFRAKVAGQSLVDRTDATKPKSGFDLGARFINPFTGKSHPIFVADYALMDYGTGAVMAVPAHDQRDFEFARKYRLPVTQVIFPESTEGSELSSDLDAAYVEDGVMRDSGAFDGQPNRTAWNGIVELAEANGWGRRTVQYRLRDWLISRQRYWGTPIPIVYCERCGDVDAVDLPVVLPDDVSFTSGGNPLATSEAFVRTACPKCGGSARRETDTMDTFVDSSWYFLRYIDPLNAEAPFDRDLADRAMPVDQYIGGVEHACMHLIYARFFTMVLSDMGLLSREEPFENLLTQGMVSLETYRCPEHDYVFPSDVRDGRCVHCGKEVVVGRVEKMSKTKKNTVDPGEIIETYGADTARTFILFAAPPESELAWSDQAVEGSWRFLRRVHDLVEQRRAAKEEDAGEGDRELRAKAHETIVRVTRDIRERFQFNTAVAALMELLNAISAHGARTPASNEAIEILVKCLAPMAPHLAEELWTMLGHTSMLVDESWPVADESALARDTIELPVQVNGRLKGTIVIASGESEENAVAAARRELALAGSVRKVIYKPPRILNIVMGA